MSWGLSPRNRAKVPGPGIERTRSNVLRRGFLDFKKPIAFFRCVGRSHGAPEFHTRVAAQRRERFALLASADSVYTVYMGRDCTTFQIWALALEELYPRGSRLADVPENFRGMKWERYQELTWQRWRAEGGIWFAPFGAPIERKREWRPPDSYGLRGA